MFALGGISGIGLSGTESTDSFLLTSLFLSTFTERANWATWSERSKVKKSVLNLQLKQFEIPKKMLYCLHFLKSKKEFIFLQVSWQIIVKVSGRDWIPTFDRAQFWASSGRRSRKSSGSTRKMFNQKKSTTSGNNNNHSGYHDGVRNERSGYERWPVVVFLCNTLHSHIVSVRET